MKELGRVVRTEKEKELSDLQSKSQKLKSDMAKLVKANMEYQEKIDSMGELKRQSNINIWNQEKVEKHRDELLLELKLLQQVRPSYVLCNMLFVFTSVFFSFDIRRKSSCK